MSGPRQFTVTIKVRKQQAIGLAEPRQFTVSSGDAGQAMIAALDEAWVLNLEVFGVMSVVELEPGEAGS